MPVWCNYCRFRLIVHCFGVIFIIFVPCVRSSREKGLSTVFLSSVFLMLLILYRCKQLSCTNEAEFKKNLSHSPYLLSQLEYYPRQISIYVTIYFFVTIIPYFGILAVVFCRKTSIIVDGK